MRIKFTEREMATYAAYGVQRTANALAKGRQGAHGIPKDVLRWQIDAEAALAEAAAAHALGLEYKPETGTLDTDRGDIGFRLQVRSTSYPNGNLLVHDKDKDRDKFILVTGIYGTYDVRGWIYAEEGKYERYKRHNKGRWAYWISQDLLRPLGTVLDAP